MRICIDRLKERRTFRKLRMKGDYSFDDCTSVVTTCFARLVQVWRSRARFAS